MKRTIILFAAFAFLLVLLLSPLVVTAESTQEQNAEEIVDTQPQAVEIVPDCDVSGGDVPASETADLFYGMKEAGEFTVTYYDVCVECCGKTDGITASGAIAEPYVTCAVDPSVIPLGSDVLVDYGDGEIVSLRAEDTGGSVKGNHIDICVSNHQEALELGRRTATVYWRGLQ